MLQIGEPEPWERWVNETYSHTPLIGREVLTGYVVPYRRFYLEWKALPVYTARSRCSFGGVLGSAPFQSWGENPKGTLSVGTKS